MFSCVVVTTHLEDATSDVGSMAREKVIDIDAVDWGATAIAKIAAERLQAPECAERNVPDRIGLPVTPLP